MSKFPLRLLLAVIVLGLTACGQQRVVLVEPKEDDLVILNGCVISACNYLAITKAQHKLEPDYWAKVLLVRFDNHSAGHAYCIWETNGTIYGYDRNSGGFPIPVYTRDPRAIAIVLAGQLSKIMNENLSVKSAEFVEPSKVDLYSFSVSNVTSEIPPALLSTAPFPARSLTLRTASESARE
ncbi:MAG: hypothetical protein ABI946_11410 [Chthoniobacterales bacterium]